VAATPAAEQTIWQGSPSQWLNFRTFLVWGVVALLVLAALLTLLVAPPAQLASTKGVALIILLVLLLIDAFFVLRAWLRVSTIKYEISTERLRITRGILSREMDNLELYRVDDTLVEQPFLLRLVGRGNIVLVTSDRTTPRAVIEAVPNVVALRDQVRRYVELCRDRKRTRVLDMELSDDDLQPQ